MCLLIGFNTRIVLTQTLQAIVPMSSTTCAYTEPDTSDQVNLVWESLVCFAAGSSYPSALVGRFRGSGAVCVNTRVGGVL